MDRVTFFQSLSRLTLFPRVLNRSSTFQRFPQNEIRPEVAPSVGFHAPVLAYFASRFLLIGINQAEFTDGYQLLTWSLDHPIRWHPLYPLLVKSLSWAIDPVIAGRLVSIFSGMGAMLALAFLTARLYGAKPARIMAWAYAASPLFLWCNLRVLTESTFQLFFVLSVYQFLLAIRQKDGYAAPVFYFISGLSVLTRPEGYVFLPFLILLFARELRHRMMGRALLVRFLAFSPWMLSVYWSFLISSRDSYSKIAALNVANFNFAQALTRLASYLELYPYVIFYPLAVFALAHVIRKGATPPWRAILLYVHIAFAMILFLHPAWSTRFLTIPISFLLVEASAGLAREKGKIRALVIACCFIFAFLSVYLQRETFLDFKQAAKAVKNIRGVHRVISDEQAKTEYYLEKRVIPFKPDLPLQRGDVLILHSYNTELNAAKQLLDERYTYRALYSTESYIIPLLANTALASIEQTNSTNAILQRFHKQRFQSVVVVIEK